MKNILIGGTVRAGKSTLANLIRNKFKYSLVESDTIVNAFDVVFPELGITHKKAEITRERYKPFLFEILNGFCRDLKYNGNVTIFPGAQFLPEQIDEYLKKDKFIVIFLGIGDATPRELMTKIREMDTASDWTNKRTDEQLLNNCKNIINESKELKSQCEKFGFYYFDTFINRIETLNKILKVIEKENENIVQ